MQENAPLTITVPEAGDRLGLSRNTAYAAAKAGQLPTIKFGKLLRVPVRALEKMLDNAGPKDGAA
jgi:excisionase family DNA binding protein